MLENRPTKAAEIPSVAKWGEAAKAGFQIVPDILLRKQHQLGLSAADLVVLLNLTMHAWLPGTKPFPRTTSIAIRMGIQVRGVQRSLARLQDLGLIEKTTIRTPKGEQPGFDLRGLVERLQALAVDDPAYRPDLYRLTNDAAA